MSKNAKIVWWVIGIIVVVGLVWWGIAKNNGSSNTIQIGFIGPLTGDEASVGTVQRAAVQVAVAEINAAGGINGKQVVVDYEDGQCASQPAVSAAQKLISVDKVVAIIGGTCSSETSAFGPVAMQDKVIVMSPSASAPSLSSLGQYFFRAYPSDSFAGKFAADYAYQKLGARKVAILYAISDWGTGLKDVFTQEFQSLGGKIVDTEGADQTATDYRTQLSNIKNADPDLIYSPMYSDGSIAALTQANELGIKTKFLGGDAWDDISLQQKVAGKGTFWYVLPAQAALPMALQQSIFAVTGGNNIPAGVGNAYDEVKILAAAIQKVGTDPDQLAAAIRATQYQGVSGNIAFDQNGDLTTAAYEVKEFTPTGGELAPIQ